ncbi:MAG: hypothetical protein Q8P67_00710 [archaeon]|nr:hypothetical protein [archaeon]
MINSETCESTTLKPLPAGLNCYHKTATYKPLLLSSSDLSCKLSEDFFSVSDGNSSFLSPTRQPFCLSAYSRTAFPDSIDGVLGLGSRRIFAFGCLSIFEMFPSSLPRILGLRLAPPSLLTLGHIDSAAADAMLWSETPVVDGLSALTFPIFSPRVCDHPLLPSTRSNRWVFLSTETPCLLLPPPVYVFFICASFPHLFLSNFQKNSFSSFFLLFFFQSLVSGTTFATLMNGCSPASQQYPGRGWSCSFPADFVLPSLDFRLQENGEVLSIDLETLVLERSWNQQTGQVLVHMCVERLVSEESDFPDAPIGFGTMVLSSFHIGIADSGRVGLSAITPAGASSMPLPSVCAPVETCTPGSTFNLMTLECEAPLCSSYFQSFDPNSLSCVYRPALMIILLVFGLAALCFDLLWTELYLCYRPRISEFFQNDPSPQELLASN